MSIIAIAVNKHKSENAISPDRLHTSKAIDRCLHKHLLLRFWKNSLTLDVSIVQM